MRGSRSLQTSILRFSALLGYYPTRPPRVQLPESRLDDNEINLGSVDGRNKNRRAVRLAGYFLRTPAVTGEFHALSKAPPVRVGEKIAEQRVILSGETSE